MSTILVVDDEPDIGVMVAVALGLDGHDVEVAEHGAAAMAAIDRRPPDLMVLDVMMPELDGWAVLARVKADPDARVRETPVVMLTAASGPVDAARGGIEGAVRYLAKPVSPDHLREVVQAALAEPEADQRRRALGRALEDLARMERVAGRGTAGPVASGPRPRLSGLERDRTIRPQPVPAPDDQADRIAAMTPQQRRVLAVVGASPTVLEAASRLGTSRSNVYATLRRIGRHLGIEGVADLVRAARAGQFSRS